MRMTSISGREESSWSRSGKSSSMDFVWMDVMTAQIEQIKEKNQRASVTHSGLGCLVQDMVANVAPVQNDDYSLLRAVLKLNTRIEQRRREATKTRLTATCTD